MIFTIRVDAVLRDALPMPSRHLVTRPTGAAVRARIQERLVAESAPTITDCTCPAPPSVR